MQTILSWGMGVESTAILLRWIFEPETCPCALKDLIILVAQTGDEYEDTRMLCEEHILPLLTRHNIRLVQVARRGHHESEGITVLSDSRRPGRLYTEGDYKLSSELRNAGTVPQFGGEHRCSLKFKAFVLESWLRDHLSTPAFHAFGYSNDEPKRVLKSDAAMARRIAFGFSEQEHGRAARATGYDRLDRTAFYPLIEWGWGRQDCLDYLAAHLGVTWQKSACVYCPFNTLGPEAIARHRLHPAQVADALHLELVSITLNPRGQLYKKKSLHEATEESGNHEAITLFERALEAQPWRLYRVRRIYAAGKDADGRALADRKGPALRSVEHCSTDLPMHEAKALLTHKAVELGVPLEERRGVSYLYVRRIETVYPTREEFFVAGPAVVDEKARFGLGWLEERWDARQATLFAAA